MDPIITNNNDVCKTYPENLKRYYTTILSQDITSDGKFLLATTSSKHLAVFPLQKYLDEIYAPVVLLENIHHHHCCSVVPAKKLLPISLVSVKNSQSIRFLTNTDSRTKFLLGGEGTIQGCNLSIDNIQECEEEWTIRLPNETTVANSLIVADNNCLVAGCSDNNIYVYDQETRQPLNKLVGHQGYIHQVKCSHSDNKHNSTKLYSASEDGSVRCWDLRQPQPQVSVLVPYKNDDLKRPNFGKWIGALDISKNNDWLVCGGGPMLSVWHLRTEKCAHHIQTPGAVYDAKFFSDNFDVIAAGSESIITVWHRSDPKNPDQIQSRINTIYTISDHYYENMNYDLFSFGGDSYQLEICRSAKMIDFRLCLA